jgi:hypothetical protein
VVPPQASPPLSPHLPSRPVSLLCSLGRPKEPNDGSTPGRSLPDPCSSALSPPPSTSRMLRAQFILPPFPLTSLPLDVPVSTAAAPPVSLRTHRRGSRRGALALGFVGFPPNTPHPLTLRPAVQCASLAHSKAEAFAPAGPLTPSWPPFPHVRPHSAIPALPNASAPPPTIIRRVFLQNQ